MDVNHVGEKIPTTLWSHGEDIVTFLWDMLETVLNEAIRGRSMRGRIPDLRSPADLVMSCGVKGVPGSRSGVIPTLI